MTTVLIDSNIVEANRFVDYTRNTIVENKKMSFEEAVKECNGITVDVFFDELRNQVREHFKCVK